MLAAGLLAAVFSACAVTPTPQPGAQPSRETAPPAAPAITSTAAPTTTAAPFVSVGGRIAFHSDPGGSDDFYLMNVDGSGLTQLTQRMETVAFPYWSPDGTRIAFVCCTQGSRGIYMMGADGSNITRLTPASGEYGEPAWSPDGTQIAFNSYKDGALYVVNVQSTEAAQSRKLAQGGGPSWSPNGERIAFFSDRDGNAEIYVMNSDGSGQTRLTNDPGADYTSRWSPNGMRIAFISERDGNAEIYAMSIDGSSQTNLSNDPAHDEFHAWSPDGTRLVYVSFRDNADPFTLGAGNAEIFVVDVADARPVNLTNNSVWDGDPVWSPDGKHIVFTRREGHAEIYVMNVEDALQGTDGSGPTRLPGVPGSANDCCAAWQPVLSSAAGEIRLDLEEFTRGFERPLYLTHAGDGSGRLFVVEQAGRIRVVEADGRVHDQPFLDIRDRVSSGGERGLLSVAFHPDYRTNGFFYVDYTDLNGDTVVARYRVSTDDPNRADPDSAQTILSIDQPAANHNGGLLLFGPDGYLYIGLGDGGGGNSQNGQRMDTLLGKLLRIDVNQTSGDKPYAIPPDNPFINDPNVRPEIWASGLRNPWRFSFDRTTGDLYIGDVGSGTYEEISFQPANSKGGENYGWSLMEGTSCREGSGCDVAGLILPLVEYNHSASDSTRNCVVVGGYVYRGSRYPTLQGSYFFGDYCSGRIWAFAAANAAARKTAYRELLDTDLRIGSFGEDEAGELFVVDIGGGGVYRITVREAD